MTPVSIPKIPDPPAGQQLYTLGDLKMFEAFTLETYRARFGEDPPDFDPNTRPKYWFDTTPGDGTGFKVYYTFAAGSDGKVTSQSVPLSDAARSRVNIPHDRLFSKWEPAPTAAKQANSFGGYNPVNVESLATLDQASNLQAELAAAGFPSLVNFMDYGQFGVVFPPEEQRKQYTLDFQDPASTRIFVGALLKEKYLKGVGAPGKWVATANGGLPGWVSDTPMPTPGPVLDQVPFPMRPLNTDETFRQDGFTGMARVQRGSLSVDQANFGPGDRSAIQGIAANVETVRQLVLNATKAR